MSFKANDTSVMEFFMKEKNARILYSQKIHDKTDPSENFYEENVENSKVREVKS